MPKKKKKTFFNVLVEAQARVEKRYPKIDKLYTASQNLHDDVGQWIFRFGTSDGKKSASIIYTIAGIFSPIQKEGQLLGLRPIPLPQVKKMGPVKAKARAKKAGYDAGIDYTLLSYPIHTLQPFWLFNMPNYSPACVNVLVTVPTGQVITKPCGGG